MRGCRAHGRKLGKGDHGLLPLGDDADDDVHCDDADDDVDDDGHDGDGTPIETLGVWTKPRSISCARSEAGKGDHGPSPTWR